MKTKRTKSLETAAKQYVRMAVEVIDETKERRDRVERAFIRTVRGMRAALGIPESERLPLSSPKYKEQIRVAEYVDWQPATRTTEAAPAAAARRTETEGEARMKRAEQRRKTASEEPRVSPTGRYTIRQACDILGIGSANTLRRYTMNGMIQCGFRSTNGRRFYTGIEIIKFWNSSMFTGRARR